jgi:hypothetical protein
MIDPKGPVKPYKSPKEIATKYKLPLSKIMQQVKTGTKVEGEHTTSKSGAKITALQHVDELPNYYTRLKKVEKKKSVKEDKDPCWKGYTQVGMKKKGGKEVPNCVPSNGVPKAKGYKVDEQIENTDTKFDKFDRRVNAAASAKTPGLKIEILKSAAKLHPSKLKSTDEEYVKESFKRIQTSGQMYSIILNFMGKTYTIKIYFPGTNSPSLQEVNDAVQKIYPGGKVLTYMPCMTTPSYGYIVANEGISFDVGGKKTTGMGTLTPQDVDRLKQGNPGAAEKIDQKYQQLRRGISLPLASRGKGGSPYEPYSGPEKKGPYVPKPKLQVAHVEHDSKLVESDDHAIAARHIEIETEMRKRSKNYLLNIGVIGESAAWTKKSGKHQAAV